MKYPMEIEEHIFFVFKVILLRITFKFSYNLVEMSFFVGSLGSFQIVPFPDIDRVKCRKD